MTFIFVLTVLITIFSISWAEKLFEVFTWPAPADRALTPPVKYSVIPAAVKEANIIKTRTITSFFILNFIYLPPVLYNTYIQF